MVKSKWSKGFGITWENYLQATIDRHAPYDHSKDEDWPEKMSIDFEPVYDKLDLDESPRQITEEDLVYPKRKKKRKAKAKPKLPPKPKPRKMSKAEKDGHDALEKMGEHLKIGRIPIVEPWNKDSQHDKG